ncbi:hypothetical protein O1L60_02725 [Streptomyces diastatochromogenes]|nr:hypothetical protein [Streptomyces diastatochromogenes]
MPSSRRGAVLAASATALLLALSTTACGTGADAAAGKDGKVRCASRTRRSPTPIWW